MHVSDLILMSDLPLATDTFYGRTGELETMHKVLDPSKPGRKGMALFGVAGSGKTQLALRYIRDTTCRFTAIAWINASSKEQMSQSFTEVSEAISISWPSKDLPVTYRGPSMEKRVLSRLRTTLYSQWLLVIDSADDTESINIWSLIPDCRHGSIIVTSTRRTAAELFESNGLAFLEIDSLDKSSASQLLFSSAHYKTTESQAEEGECQNAHRISQELYGIPLAIEQAGALI